MTGEIFIGLVSLFVLATPLIMLGILIAHDLEERRWRKERERD